MKNVQELPHSHIEALKQGLTMSKCIFQTNAVIEAILKHDFRNGSGLARYNQKQPLGPYREKSIKM